MSDHIEEAIQLVTDAHDQAAERMDIAIREAADELVAQLLPHVHLSEADLDAIVRSGVNATASGILGASTEVLRAMFAALTTLQAHTEARDLPDTPPSDWEAL